MENRMSVSIIRQRTGISMSKSFSSLFLTLVQRITFIFIFLLSLKISQYMYVIIDPISVSNLNRPVLLFYGRRYVLQNSSTDTTLDHWWALRSPHLKMSLIPYILLRRDLFLVISPSFNSELLLFCRADTVDGGCGGLHMIPRWAKAMMDGYESDGRPNGLSS